MAYQDFPPADFEVKDQLSRILMSPRFRNAPNPSAFLNLTVHRALRGEKSPGRVIAEIFGERFIKGVSPDIRVAAKKLRDTLKRYYSGEGRTDVVIIEYPIPAEDRTIKPVEGEAYTPNFSYNPDHDPFIWLRVAYRFLQRKTYRDLYSALNLFTSVLENKPGDFNGLLGIAETLCEFRNNGWMPQWSQWRMSEEVVLPVFGCSLSEIESKLPNLSLSDLCDDIFMRLRSRTEVYWRYWAARACFCQTDGLIKPAAKYYGAALELNQPALESFVPYIDFLIKKGDTEQALSLAQRYVNERVEDSHAVGEYGRLLCYAGRQEIGIRHLQAALQLEPGNCAVHQLLAVIRFMQKDLNGVAAHLRAVRQFADPETFSSLYQTLEKYEGQYQLEGSIANLLLGMPNDLGGAIVKR